METAADCHRLVDAVLTVSRRFAHCVQSSHSEAECIQQMLDIVLDVATVDAVTLWLPGPGGPTRHERARGGPAQAAAFAEPPEILRVVHDLLRGSTLPETLGVAPPACEIWEVAPPGGAAGADDPAPPDRRSMCFSALRLADEATGVLALTVRRPRGFAPQDQALALALGNALAVFLALASSRRQLSRRIEELSCLYDIVQLVALRSRSLDELLAAIVERLPRAWPFPEAAVARIEYEGRTFETAHFGPAHLVQAADIVRHGQRRGHVEVGYVRELAERPAATCMRDEQRLLEAVADDIGLIAERLEAQERRAGLEEQLRHADRLATIGQMAAGVAHELNEPLANALGYAELALKAPELPPQAGADLRRVVGAALHARDIIRRLLVFARPAKPTRETTDLNDIVRSVLGFLEPRCRREGIALATELAEPAPHLEADPVQLRQVLVNLAVNAIQAMPHGGRLDVRTSQAGSVVRLSVEDTGAGMSEAVCQQIFDPFFTTKAARQGTGLGLCVVQDIVSAHRGAIQVDSRPGEGSRFTVTFPVAPAAPNEERP